MAAGASCGLWWWCGRETTHDDGVIPLGGRGVDVALSSSDGGVAGLLGICLAVVKHMVVCRGAACVHRWRSASSGFPRQAVAERGQQVRSNRRGRTRGSYRSSHGDGVVMRRSRDILGTGAAESGRVLRCLGRDGRYDVAGSCRVCCCRSEL